MTNVWVIFRKEIRSYFVSPIAYLMLTLFAVVSAFFFGIYLRGFIEYGMEMQMSEARPARSISTNKSSGRCCRTPAYLACSSSQ